MEKATNVIVTYDPSDNIKRQGKYEDIKKYLNRGYYIKEERNGFWILVKTSSLRVTLENSNGSNTFSVKDAVLRYYNRQKLTETLVNKFENDIRNNKITFEMSENLSEWNMR